MVYLIIPSISIYGIFNIVLSHTDQEFSVLLLSTAIKIERAKKKKLGVIELQQRIQYNPLKWDSDNRDSQLNRIFI